MFTRRRFLQGLGALAASPQLQAQDNPFALGVASGYPTPASVVLWTRLLGVGEPRVRWEVAADEAMRKVVLHGETDADPAWAHSVHVEVEGLQPDRWYWYRFRSGNVESTVGRTRTAPAPGSTPAALRFAFASCQHYEQGYFGAYRHIVADRPDLVAFLGDYIYESSWGRDHVRKHGGQAPRTLDEYRARHALYKSDVDLQAAHAAAPWIVTWDDHEVVNDYAGERGSGESSERVFLARRRAAYRAFYEHMPLPERMRPGARGMRIYTQLDWGALASFFVLDSRQYRSYQACRETGTRSAPVVDPLQCAELGDPARTMLGREQELWLGGALARSGARWNLITQQTPMAQFDQKPGPGRGAWTDGWDGYPAARSRLFDSLAGISNPVVIGGDVHSFNVADLKRNFDDPASPVMASEFVGTSITSQAWPHEKLLERLPDNPHIKLADGRSRGYVRMELAPGLCRADLRAMQSVQRRDAPCSTLASFVVEDGRPGPQRA